MERFKEYLVESSLSRIYQKTKDFDAGAISGFRREFTRSQNMSRNKEILAYLLNANYSVTKVMGSYIENHGSANAREVGEESFFVVDQEKTGRLKDDLIKLGRMYDQDSILWVHRGSSGVLIGTSKRDDSFPGYNVTKTAGKANFGDAVGPFFSRIRGRVFAFESVESIAEMKVPGTINGKWAMSIMAKELHEKMENFIV